MKQHHKLLIGLVLGATLGVTLHAHADWAWLSALARYVFEPLGQIFLRMIFMIVVPLVFSGLVLGVFQLGQHHGLGKVASRTLLYTFITSMLSVFIGVGLVNLFKPGKSFQVPAAVTQVQPGSVEQIQSDVARSKSIVDALLDVIPRNPLEAAARALDGEMLALMFFALIFGIALSSVTQIKKEWQSNVLTDFLEIVYETCMAIVDFVMKLAPYAVFSLVFTSTFKFGYNLLVSLFFYVLVVILALAIQQFVVYTSMLKAFTKRSPWEFFKSCSDVYIYAFATASSNATLPRSLEVAEEKLKLPSAISRFVLTVGSTANQNGTALFEGITVLFLAQVYGVDLSIGQQFQVVVMSILAGIGTAGVPGGSLPLIMVLLMQMGIPAEGLGLILGVDRFLDMCRTTINVGGDLVITAMVSDNTDA